MKRLVRLRADPEKIRVSVRRVIDGFRVTVTELRDGRYHYVVGRDAEEALRDALVAARDAGYNGVDVELTYTYRHPQWREERENA